MRVCQRVSENYLTKRHIIGQKLKHYDNLSVKNKLAWLMYSI